MESKLHCKLHQLIKYLREGFASTPYATDLPVALMNLRDGLNNVNLDTIFNMFADLLVEIRYSAEDEVEIDSSELLPILKQAKEGQKKVVIGLRHPNPNQDPPFGKVCCWPADSGDPFIHLVSPVACDFYVRLSDIAWITVNK